MNTQHTKRTSTYIRRPIARMGRAMTARVSLEPVVTTSSSTATQLQKNWVLRLTKSIKTALLFKLRRIASTMPNWAWLSCAIVVVFSLTIFIFSNLVHADSQGPLSASAIGNCVDDASIGTVTWTSPGNAFSANSFYATASVDGTTTHYIVCTNFGFTIPTGSTINGIVVGVNRKSSSTGNGGSNDAAMRVVKGGAIGTTDRSTTTTYTTTDTYEDHGTSSDLWGTTWAASDIDATNFGAAFAATKASAAGAAHTVSVDHIRITVYYTLPNSNFNQASYRLYNNQNPSSSITFANAAGGSSADYGNSVVQTSDGGYAVTGYTGSYGGGLNDVFLAKYTAAGTLSWTRTWGGSGNEYGNSVVQTSDGGYAITGYTDSYGAGSTDVFLLKYDSSGSLSWNTTWGSTSADQGNSVVQTSDGGYAVTGYNGSGDVVLIKFTSTGTISWSRSWGGTSTDQGNSVVQTSDGGYAITGVTQSFGAGGQDVILLKYDSSGTLTWNSTWGGTGNESGNSVVQTSDGGYAITGSTPLGAGGGDAFLLKYDSSGTLTWNRTWGSTTPEGARAVVQTSDGGYAITGNVSSDVFLVKYDSSGTQAWAKTWAGSGSEYGYGVVQTSDGGYAIAGYTTTYGAGSNDILLLKYDSSGAMAGCSSVCQSSTATSATPTATTSSPAATSSTPAGITTSSPAASTTSPTVTVTTVVATQPTMDVGSPLAAQNTAATIAGDSQPFRLRLDLGVSNYQADIGRYSFKLQYAVMSGTCDTAFSGETYADVTDSTTLRYYSNTSAGSGMGLTTNANDPTDGTNTLVRQTYQQAGTTTFSNTSIIPSGQDGMWDFALATYHSLQNTHYCLRVVDSSGSVLSTYTAIPEVIIPSATFSEASFRWYNRDQTGVQQTFIKAFGGTVADVGNSVVQTSDGGYAVTGGTSSYGAGGNDMFISKYDSAGTLSWSKTWGGTGSDQGNAIVQTSDGGYAVVGDTGLGAGGGDAFLAKYDSAGTLSWSVTWGGTSYDYGRSVFQTSDGGYAITGYTASYGAGTADMYLAKFTSTGTLSWSKTWGSTSDDIGNSVIQTSDGGYAVTGNTPASGYTDMFLAKYTSTGTLSWSMSWGGISSDEYGRSIVQTSDGGYAVTGTAYSSGSTSSNANMFLAKFTSTGTLSWSKIWGAAGISDNGYSVIQTSDSGYAVTGGTSSYGAGSEDMFLAKYDSSGTLSWSKTWGGTASDRGYSVVQTSDGGYAVTGYTLSYGAGSNDMFLAKYDSSGTIAGCGSPMCQSPAATTSDSTATASSLTATTSSPAATTSSPTVTETSPTLTVTVIVPSPAPIGSPLLAQNLPLDLPNLTPLNLRVAIRVDTSGIGDSGQSFKLQYAIRTSETSCSAVSTGLYADVTTATPIQYYDDSRYTSGGGITNDANDPSDSSRTIMAQTYQESNTFTNSASTIYAGQDGMWQFSLIINSSTLRGRNFCLRVGLSTDTTPSLSALYVPDIAYAPQMYQLMHSGHWFNRQGIRQNLVL